MAFPDWDLTRAQQAITDRIEKTTGEVGYTRNKKLIEEEDHWMSGVGWVGPKGTSATRSTVLAAVEPQFTPRNVSGEVVENATQGLMQREPDIEFVPLDLPPDGVPTEEQQAQADAMLRQLAQWWDRKNLWRYAKAAARRTRWAGRGALRLFLADGNLDVEESETDEGIVRIPVMPSGLTFAEALDRLDISAPLPDESVVYVDPVSRQRAAVFTFREGEDEKGDERAELWYVDGDDTVLRLLGGSEPEEFRVPLGGRLPIAEAEGDLLITETVRRQQNRLNFFESVIVKVGESAGFAERYISNAAPSGVYMKTPPVGIDTPVAHQDENGVTWYLHPLPRTLGASITTDLRGIVDADGKIMTPSVTKFDPTDPDYAIKAANHGRACILQSCRQGHLAVDSTAEASGIAYEQARAQFLADLLSNKSGIEGMLREFIGCAIAWAGAMSSEFAGFLDRYRVVVNLHITAGPITAAQQLQNNANVEAGTLSLESAMAANGVEDVDAEVQRIREAPEARIELVSKQAEAITRLVDAGLTWEEAALDVGIDDEERLARYRLVDQRRAAEAVQRQAFDDEARTARSATGDPELDRILGRSAAA